MRKPLILLTILLLLPCFTVSAYERLELVTYTWGTIDNPMDVRPGYSNVPLTILIQNLYSHYITGVYAKLYLPPGFHNSTGGNITYAAYGPSLPPGSTVPLTFTLNVDSNVKPGSYTFYMKITYYDTVYTEMESEFNLTLKVEEPKGISILSVGWGSPSQPLKPVPNSKSVPLYIWITNLDKKPISGVKLELELPEGIHGPNGDRNVTSTIPVIEAGQSTYATFLVDIDENIQVGEKTFNLTITYHDFWFSEYHQAESFKLKVYPKPDVDLFAEEVSVKQGSIVKLNLTVMNNGDESIYDVLPSLKAESLIPIKVPTDSLSELPPKTSHTFSFEVYVPSNLPPSVIPISFAVSYSDSRGLNNVKSMLTNVNVLTRSDLLKVSLSTTEIRYQRENEVLLTIVNTSNEPLKDLEAQLSLPSSIPMYIKEGRGPWRFSYVSPKSNVSMALHIIPFAQTETTVPITVTVTYRDSNDLSRSEVHTLLIYLKGYTDIELVNLKISPQPAYNGSKVIISASLLNEGTQQAYYSRVKVEASYPFIIVGYPEEKYIGDLPVNSPTPFSFQLYVANDAKPGSYEVNLKFKYTDTLGNKHEETWSIKIDVTTVRVTESHREQAVISPFLSYENLTIIVLVVLLVITIIWGYRRGERKEELEVP